MKNSYRLRKCAVERAIGAIGNVLGFRQFSLRDLAAAAGEGCLVCLAFKMATRRRPKYWAGKDTRRGLNSDHQLEFAHLRSA